MHVDFFIAGVQKSGTTALDAILRRHPKIQMAAQKEPHFFDNESLDWDAPDYPILHHHYDWSVDGVLRGEATPIYTYWPGAIERLRAYNPNAKLIIGLRHPSYRAFSHWRMETTRDAETLSFSDAIRKGRGRVTTAPHGVHRVYSYVERGFYAAQTARVLTHFPRSQTFFFRTDQLWLSPESTLAQLQSFLGVPQTSLASSPEYVVPVVSENFGELGEVDRLELSEQFERDIKNTSRITGVLLDDWLSPDYREPMRRA